MGSGGPITFRAANLEELSFKDVHRLNPHSDFKTLKEYIEELVGLLEKAWFGQGK